MSARANWQAPLVLLAAVVSAQLRDVCGHCQERAGEIFQVHWFLHSAELYWNLTFLSFANPAFVKHAQDDVPLPLNEARVQIKCMQIGLTL